jgi:hypothetical protein
VFNWGGGLATEARRGALLNYGADQTEQARKLLALTHAQGMGRVPHNPQ